MRVGIYVDKFQPEAGGGHTFAEAMLRGLGRWGAGNDCVIFNGGRRPMESPVGLPVVEVRAGAAARLRKHKHTLLRLVKQAYGHPINADLIEKGIDLLWMLTPAHLDCLAVPYAFTIWDLAHREHPYFPEVSAKRNWQTREKLYSHMVPRASIVVVGNERGREEVSRYYGVPRERIVPIEMPAPDSVAPPTSVSTIHRPYLFYPAQFWAHKNHVNAMLGLKRAREIHGIDIDLVFTGSDRGNAGYVREMAASFGLADRIQFRGFVDANEIARLYASALGLLYLSFFGPDNLPPLEAFKHGCPVIASRIPGHLEQLGDAALFADPTSPDEIADAIRRLYRDADLRARLVEKGSAIAAGRTVDRYLASMSTAIDAFAAIRRTWPLASSRQAEPAHAVV